MASARHYVHYVLALGGCVALMVAGCATTASMRPGRAAEPLGMPRYYHHTQPVIFQAAQNAARELGLTIIESVPEHSYFIARRGIPVPGWGALVGVYVEATVDNFTRVLIRTDAVFPVAMPSPEDSLRLHTLLEKKLQTM